MSYGPTPITCPKDDWECYLNNSAWEYRPSLGLNAALLGIFISYTVTNLILGGVYRTWGFSIAMVFGCIGEVIGYVGRIMAHKDVLSLNPFLIQICALTFAPAFFAAAIYLSLCRIVLCFGENLSRIPAVWYTYLFIGIDFVSLVLQGAGGGLASTAAESGRNPATGNNVMLAGLGLQVFGLVLFMALCAEYAFRVWRSPESARDIRFVQIRNSVKFKLFLFSLFIATTAVLIRSIFRVIEMAQGWEGELMGNETMFFVLEGVMVAVAVVALTVFHPGYTFAEGYGKKAILTKAQMKASNNSSKTESV